jgi:hypothetical protein
MRLLILLAPLTLSGQALRMNQVQIIGTHNSYHAGLAPSEMALLEKQNPQAAKSLAYRHEPLAAQLDAGVRQLELDVFGDVQGGLFADPLYPKLVAKAGLPAGPPHDPDGVLKKPGFKVLHVQDLDFRTHCLLLTDCLKQVRAWSKAHPKHLPIYIQIENKDGRPRPEFVAPEPLTKATMDALDREILSVFERREIVTPDDVRGKFATLEEAVLTQGWPLLDSARGKVVFLLDQERVTPLYTEGHPSLEGRVMFTNGNPGSTDCAFVKRNNPLTPGIADLVRKGYLVRTMTDGRPKEAALASGAQVLSTDHPSDWPFMHRCNPVNTAPTCKIRE